MKRIILLFTVAAMMALMALVMGAGPALAADFNGEVFSIFDEEEDEDVQVIVCDSDDGDVDRVDDVVVVFCDDDDDDDDDGLIDALFGDRFDDHHFDRFDRRDHHRHR